MFLYLLRLARPLIRVSKKVFLVTPTLFCLFVLGSLSFPQINGCMPTSNGMQPTTTTTAPSGSTTTTTSTTSTTSTTTTTAGTNCCPALVANQFANQTVFAYGNAVITFDSTTCPMSASVNCSVPNAALNLEASIRVNFVFFMIAGLNTVTFPATCVNGQWQMGTPPIVVNQMECLLAEAGTIG